VATVADLLGIAGPFEWYNVYVGTALAGAVAIGLYPFLGQRIWCRMWCPLAFWMNFWGCWSKFKISAVKGKCIDCNVCNQYCQMGIDIKSRALQGLPVTLDTTPCVGCADNHDVSPETVAEVTKHLRAHQMNSVMVRVNQYDPLGEWARLCQNQNIPLGWRLIGGSFTVLKYSLLPGRIFGEDWYNPFTESLHLYSDIPALGINEAVYARQVRDHSKPGAYATIKVVPVLGMWHETKSTQEALQYISETGTPEEREEAYRILYPSYGGNWGAGLGSIVPFGSAYMRIVGSIFGHAANGVRTIASPEE